MFYEDCTLEEILAYRELESATFNFGDGDIKMEGLFGSEDVYYKMNIRMHLESLYSPSLQSYYDKEYNGINKNSKTRRKRNNHFNKKFEKRKLNKLSKTSSWWVITDKGTHKTRYYLSQGSRINRKKLAKRQTNKRIRHHKKDINNGSYYKKFYDYWWEVL